jgi:hypothetical protein
MTSNHAHRLPLPATGYRRGEISALDWRHVDFERGLLSIIPSNAQPKAGTKEKHTETGQDRKIALDKHTVGLLGCASVRRLRGERATCKTSGPRNDHQRSTVASPAAGYLEHGAPTR